jgi:ketosteroid isomerase-like protein
MDHDQNQLRRLLRERYDYFERMFEAGAIAELVQEFYTDDAVVDGYGISPQVGKAAITAIFNGAREAGFSRLKIDDGAVAVPSADLAYQFITNDNVPSSGAVEVHRALIVWRKTVQGWKCEVDFFCPRTAAVQLQHAPNDSTKASS